MTEDVTPPYEGRHLLADLKGCKGLDDLDLVDRALRAAVVVAGARLIDLRLHTFGKGHGVTGVALLAESHISIHTWPEHGYAAIDIFLCGYRHDLDGALACIKSFLQSEDAIVRVIERGFSCAPNI